MPRVPYVSDSDAGPADLVAEIRARRGGKLLNLDRMLLASPPLARGWNAHLGAVRSGLSLEARLRELAICAVAVLNGAPYELEHHLPLYREAGGSERAAEALRSFETGDPAFDGAERAVLALTVEMTREVSVSDATFRRARSELPGEREIVELVAVIATYNMVSRFLVALGIETEGPGR
ncbi:MAG TPA: carboxymuconolactone decarboxylase family protein [Steroidobacteraceae bacterium]|nr:carboxymuconolactone decarboxylase family protein [Steroidobacteraceae bacterium]